MSEKGFRELTIDLEAAELRLKITNQHIENLELRQPQTTRIEELTETLREEQQELKALILDIKQAIDALPIEHGENPASQDATH